jgi:hypothetical protein
LRMARNRRILHMPMEWMNLGVLTSSVASLTPSENILTHDCTCCTVLAGSLYMFVLQLLQRKWTAPHILLLW